MNVSGSLDMLSNIIRLTDIASKHNETVSAVTGSKATIHRTVVRMVGWRDKGKSGRNRALLSEEEAGWGGASGNGTCWILSSPFKICRPLSSTWT